MEENNLIIKLLPHAEGMGIPSYATSGSSCMDLSAAIKEDFVLKPNERFLCPTGMIFAINPGFEVQIRPRSGMAFKYGITVLNSPGTIDSDYRGEIKVLLVNFGQNDFVIKPKMKIAQFVLSKCEKFRLLITENMDNTTRGNKGFGSTGL